MKMTSFCCVFAFCVSHLCFAFAKLQVKNLESVLVFVNLVLVYALVYALTSCSRCAKNCKLYFKLLAFDGGVVASGDVSIGHVPQPGV